MSTPTIIAQFIAKQLELSDANKDGRKGQKVSFPDSPVSVTLPHYTATSDTAALAESGKRVGAKSLSKVENDDGLIVSRPCIHRAGAQGEGIVMALAALARASSGKEPRKAKRKGRKGAAAPVPPSEAVS